MEGKKKYFALVLFLFLGLMIFTFANPVEEEKEFKDGNKEQSEKVTDKKEDTTKQDKDTNGQEQQNVQNNVTNTNANNNNANTQNREDDSLARALAAVELAEGSYKQEDLDAAKELVNNVTDTTEKGNLQERLDEVEAGIAVLALLENLETQVEEAAAKVDMTNATTYRDDNEIADKINELTNETVKTTLQERLAEVSKLLDDNTAPSVNVEAKAYKENVTITAEDANGFTLFLAKNTGKEEQIENNTETVEEGIYTLRMIDEAFNEQTIRFIVDGTDPVLKDLTNGGHYKEVTINVEDLSETTIKVTNMDKNETTEVENGTKLTDEATYKIEVEDEAGNKTTYYVAIDKTKPAISTTDKSIINYTKWTEVTDKFLTIVRITREAPDGTITTEEFTRANFEVGERNENFKFRYKLKEEGKYTIYGEDKFGNFKEETVTVDKTAAKLVSANMYSNGTKYTEDKNVVYYTTDGNTITAYVRVNEQLKVLPTITLKVGEKTYTATNVVEAFHNANDEAAGIYRYQATVSVDEFDPEDGDVSVLVSNIEDKAGNKTADVTSVTNKNIVRIDRTEASRVYSTIRSKANQEVHENGKDIDFYHKNGTEFEYAISFNELLATAPTVTIAGREVEMKLNEKVLNNENKFLYEGTFKIREDEAELAEGTLEIKVTNIKDLAGNETVLGDQTKTSNGRRVIYDRTAAIRQSADFYVSGLTQIEKTFYTKYGKKIVANITTNEELGEVPTFTLHNNGKDYVIEGAIYRGLNDKGYHLYQASYELKEESGMTDGEITFTVSNIHDKAGNTTNDITEATNGRKIVLDTAVKVDKLAIIGKNGQWKDKEYIQYANTGTIVYVNARFKEELAETPVVKLNDKITLTTATKKLSNGIWIYSYSYKLVENDGLEDGTIQVKVTNIKDFAGNTTELTNEHMTMESQSEVVVDRTLPTYRFTKAGSSLAKDEITPIEKDGVYYFNQNVRVTLSDSVNLRLHGVDTYYDDKNAKRTGWLTDVKTDGEHTAVAVDAAGNRLEFKFVIDTTAPVIELAGTAGKNKNEMHVESGTPVSLQDVIAKVTDNIDGEYTIEPYKADLLIGTKEENIYDYDFSNGFDTHYTGRYNIYYKTKDFVGNETTATMLLVMKDTTAAEIILPGDEGRNANEYRILEGSFIDVEYIYAKVTDNVDKDTEILPTSITKYYPSETGKASHKYTLEERTIKVNGQEVVQKYFDTATAGEYYAVKYEYTDSSKNKTSKTMLLVVDALYEPVIENNQINLDKNITLNDRPFYNDRERTEDLTINGNGKTITQQIDRAYKYTWDITGTRPFQSNMFTTANGSKVTVNDLTFKGSMYSMTLGHYRSKDQAGFNTELNNVNIIDVDVASFSAGISPAVTVYGTAVLNNTNIYGSKLSALDTDPMWPVYDLALVNYTNTTINGGKIGSIYTWPKAYLEINNAEVDTIISKIRKTNDFTKGELLIAEGTKVNKVIIQNERAVITVKAGATVDTLDISAYDEKLMTFNIEPGATINTVITKDGEMPYSDWYRLITTKEKLDTAMKLGGELKLIHDIEVAKTIVQPETSHVTLDMDGKKLTIAGLDADPMINQKTGSSLVITGNGTVDLEDNYYASFIAPRGDVTIENGTFLRKSGKTAKEYGSFFIGISGGKGKLIINGGYFDGGYYKEGDEFNNSRTLLNLSWGQYVRVNGGTFVGQNPAYADEGMAKTNPNSTSTYCQGVFFEGQTWTDTDIPSAYTVTKGTHEDGRPTYTVNYKMPQ